MDIELYSLTKSDWNKLAKAGLTDSGEGNGFANTTEIFDNTVACSAAPAFIQVKHTVYKVQYKSGCFYPVWHKVYSVKPNYIVDKNNNINHC